MISLDAATVLLQWATGGLLFTWVTTRHREVGLGYGWLMRGTFIVVAAGALACGLAFGSVPVREAASAGVIAGDHGRAGRVLGAATGAGCPVSRPSTTAAAPASRP